MTDIEALMVMNWSLGEKIRVVGTEDWIVVAELENSVCYDWAEFRAFYSPAFRRYFWHSDVGCSCSAWSDVLYEGVNGFENGSRDDVLRAWTEFSMNNQNDFTTIDRFNGVTKIRTFKEPK